MRLALMLCGCRGMLSRFAVFVDDDGALELTEVNGIRKRGSGRC